MENSQLHSVLLSFRFKTSNYLFLESRVLTITLQKLLLTRLSTTYSMTTTVLLTTCTSLQATQQGAKKTKWK